MGAVRGTKAADGGRPIFAAVYERNARLMEDGAVDTVLAA
jgi:hypothetical protein